MNAILNCSAFNYHPDESGFTLGLIKRKIYCCSSGTCKELNNDKTCKGNKYSRSGHTSLSASYIVGGKIYAPDGMTIDDVVFPPAVPIPVDSSLIPEPTSFSSLGGKTRRRKGRKGRKSRRKSRRKGRK